MKLIKKAGATSEIWQVFIRDSSSGTGAGLTGLANNSPSLTAYYHRDTDTTATAISLVSMTVGTFTSSGFKEIDATNMPGWYQFCPPNAALAASAKSCGFLLKGATNMAPLPIETQLVAFDPDDTVRLGLTALPNAAAEAAGGLYTRGTGAGQINQANNGQVDANAARLGGTTQTGRDVGASVLLSTGTGTGQLDFTGGVVKSNLVQILGTALTETSGQIAAAFKKWFDVATPTGTVNSIPNAVAGAAGGLFIAGTNAATTITTALTTTFTGNLTGSVNSVTTGVTLAGAAVQAIWDALTSALTTSGSIGKLLVDNINATISSRLASGSYTTPPTVQQVVDGVWDEPIVDHLDSGSTGAALNAAGAAGDPWSTTLPGSYGAGTAGKIVGDNVNATISSRLASASYTAPDNTSIIAIKTKTDQLTFTSTNVNANVQVNSDKTGYALSSAAVQAIWDALTSALTTIGSIGKLLVDNINATISSRLPTSSYTAPDNSSITAIKAKTDNLPAAPASTGDVTTVGTAVAAVGTAVAAVSTKLGTPAGASVSADIAQVEANVILVKAQTDLLPGSPASTTVKKNTALAHFTFPMTSASGAPLTGLTVTAQRSIDGAVLASCTNSVVEIGSGLYQINLSAADLNGDVIAFLFSAVSALTTRITVLTEE